MVQGANTEQQAFLGSSANSGNQAWLWNINAGSQWDIENSLSIGDSSSLHPGDLNGVIGDLTNIDLVEML